MDEQAFAADPDSSLVRRGRQVIPRRLHVAQRPLGPPDKGLTQGAT